MRIRVLLCFTVLAAAAVAALQAQKLNSMKEFIDVERTKKLASLTVVYETRNKELMSVATMRYSFPGGIEVDMKDVGTFSSGGYKVRLDSNYFPVYAEHDYTCAIERLEYYDTYTYQNDRIRYVNLRSKQQKTIEFNRMTADNLTLLELLVFLDTDKVKRMNAEIIVPPGATQLPFLFKYSRDETLMVEGKPVDCYVYIAELDSFLSPVVTLFYGDAKIWLRKEFPHVRIKMDFFRKIMEVKSFSIQWK